MPCPGKARVGHKAPDFKCEAVMNGKIQELTLDYYLAKKQWIILLFIPAAFSVVCPTEVLAFHNCIDEFTERNCAVAFVSTDSKFSLWQWQNLPRQHGGIGRVSVPLLSDQSHSMSRDYGVLLESASILRGQFIIDPKGIIQQITINNINVGRSVLEALRLVEAFKAVAEKGALCPANWKSDLDSIVDTTYDEQDHQLAQELGDLKVKNLDDNTEAPLSLGLLPIKGSQGSNQASSTASVSTSKRNSTVFSQKRNSTTHNQDNNIVTLDFADLLDAPRGATSPHEYVNVQEPKNAEESSTSGVKRTVDALKRFSGGWSTPLGSPLSGPVGHNKTGSVQSSYFE